MLFIHNRHPTTIQQRSLVVHAAKVPRERSGGQTAIVQNPRRDQVKAMAPAFVRIGNALGVPASTSGHSILSELSPIAKGINGRVRWPRHWQRVLLALSTAKHLLFLVKTS